MPTKRVEEIAVFMADWLGFNQVVSAGVEVVLRFPNARAKSYAVRQILMNLHPSE